MSHPTVTSSRHRPLCKQQTVVVVNSRYSTVQLSLSLSHSFAHSHSHTHSRSRRGRHLSAPSLHAPTTSVSLSYTKELLFSSPRSPLHPGLRYVALPLLVLNEVQVEHLRELLPSDHMLTVEGRLARLLINRLIDVAVVASECALQVVVLETCVDTRIPLFLSALSLCLSRACLGKRFIFSSYKMAQRI